MDADKDITATFEMESVITYSLTVNTAGSGSVSVVPDKTEYEDGEIITLTAEANVGWVFSDWSGDVISTNNPVLVTMDADKVITATFETEPVITYSLTVNTVGSGSVSVVPDKSEYNEGEIVSLTAAADPGWIFSDWSGDVVSTTNPVLVTMDADKVITATFKMIITKIYLPLIINGNGP
jgi:hypothetical protein